MDCREDLFKPSGELVAPVLGCGVARMLTRTVPTGAPENRTGEYMRIGISRVEGSFTAA